MSDSDRVNILLVDDQPAKLLTYEAILGELRENLIRAGSAREALEILLKTEVAVLLVDVIMPELDGFELAAMVRGHPRFQKTSIIFISAILQGDTDRVRGYESGAVDYVPVPIVLEILRAKVKIFAELYRKTRQLEQMNAELERRVTERTAELEASMMQLRSSEERYRTVVEGSLEGISVQQDGRISYANGALAQMFGYGGPSEHIGKDMSSLARPDEVPRLRQRLEQCLAGEPQRLHGWRAIRADAAELRISSTAHRIDWKGRPAVVKFLTDITARKQAEERQNLLMAELDHRVKNVLANVAAIARLSSARAASVPGFVKALEGRIQAMSGAHALLRQGNWDSASVAELVGTALVPFRSGAGVNIEARGDPIRVHPPVAQSLALVLNELATNALKHGALSVPGGKVAISWSRVREGDDEQMRFGWRESGGPKVKQPDRKGFGIIVLESVASEGVSVSCDFNEQGFVYTLEGPLAAPDRSGREAPNGKTNGADHQPQISGAGSTAPRRILVVEDEPMIALQLKTDLESDGHEVISPAFTLAQGLELAERGNVNAALVDVSLGRDTSIPLAERLALKKIPFAFVTGYSDAGTLPEQLRAVPRMQKPYRVDDVRLMLSRLGNYRG